MRVRVAKWGNSTAVRLPKAATDELRVSPGEEIEIVVESGAVRLCPISKPPFYRLEDLVAEMKRLGPGNEPLYEDWSAVEAPRPDDTFEPR